MAFTHTGATNDAMLLGVAALLDADAEPAYAILYEGATALVTMIFAKPAASLVAHELVFAQGDATGDFIHEQGEADGFELYNGAGALLGTGDVTDTLGSGALKVSGTTGTLLYAGARAILAELKMA
ncbi:hypothetical protein [Acidovorax cavernicola]|uniref:Uncharacterized protein n=1 Tax=Acidovorax cavernicola TaxID=1675792 RepID=A0A9X8D4A5_9BURK|nr:hypothetical protein [Acidovorax cavernicola]RIX79112.1 hypothetical protein D3H34_15340 [Acidovorax cavernicola]